MRARVQARRGRSGAHQALNDFAAAVARISGGRDVVVADPTDVELGQAIAAAGVVPARGEGGRPLVAWAAAGVALEGLDRAVEQVCKLGDDIVVLRADPAGWDSSLGLPPLPEDWARAFARAGYARDVDDLDAAECPGASRYRRLEGGLEELAESYERRFSVLSQVARARRELLIADREALAAAWHELRGVRALMVEQSNRMAELDAEARDLRERNEWLTNQVAALQAWREGFQATPAWKVAKSLQDARGAVLPPGSRREAVFVAAGRAPADLRRDGASAAVGGVMAAMRAPTQQPLEVAPVEPNAPPGGRGVEVDVVVCVHNALDDVRRCLESVLGADEAPPRLILVDDGSDEATAAYLDSVATQHGAVLIRNNAATGYTRAANQGLGASTAPLVCLLNSDTIVSRGWLDRLAACALQGPKIGLVGPLSNTASWQSVPDVEADGDWAANPLPEGVTPADVAQAVAEFTARVYPAVPLLNGFCLILRRELLDDVGPFDEEAFGAGYGEEDDLAFRARAAGWALALADDAYVYHAQSKSYSDERRKELSSRAQSTLAARHGADAIASAVREMSGGRVMSGVRVRAGLAPERRAWVDRGRAYSGKRILFMLPVASVGGGANVVLFEAAAMARMGVQVALFNRPEYRSGFEMAYAETELPVIYGDRADVARVSRDFDAVVATAHYSVPWLEGVPRGDGAPIRGYYVQGFEPFMHPAGSLAFQQAWDSYTAFDDLVRFAKTEWNRGQVERLASAQCGSVGISMDVDLFTPRPRPGPEWPGRPLRIAAMIRPESPFRGPEITMATLQATYSRHGAAIEPWLFGAQSDSDGFRALPQAFPWKNAGVIGTRRVATLLNQVDIFVDFSTHQAMGLTALEAMACGAAVIVPTEGGAVEFVRHEQNGLVVDTTAKEHCIAALDHLIVDHAARMKMQRQAILDAAQYFPERAAFRMLEELFGPRERASGA